MPDTGERGDTLQHVRELYDRFFNPDMVRRESIATIVADLPYEQLTRILDIMRGTTFDMAKQRQLIVTPAWFARTRLEFQEVFESATSPDHVDEAICQMRREDPTCEESFLLLNPDNLVRICKILDESARFMKAHRAKVHREPDVVFCENAGNRMARPLFILRYWHSGFPLHASDPSGVPSSS